MLPKKEKEFVLTSTSIKTNIDKVNFVEALKQYIWNSFDAGASLVEVIFEDNALKGGDYIRVKDNGRGINFNSLSDEFLKFGDSSKAHKSFISSLHGQKGKGKFYFINFAGNVEWQTVYEDPKNGKYEFTISISRTNLKKYESTEPKLTKKPLGTEAIFTNLSITEYTRNNTNIEENFAKEFGAFLYLNKSKNFKLVVDNKIITYSELIEKTKSEDVKINNTNFKVTYIKWDRKINEKPYIYFLDTNNKLKACKLSRFSDKKDKFYHNVYVESEFYNNFTFVQDDDSIIDSEAQENLNTPADNTIYASIYEKMNEMLLKEHSDHLREYSVNTLIRGYREKNLFPIFKNNDYDKIREKELVTIVREMYISKPVIFNSLNNTQSKTMLGLLNLLLDSDARMGLLDFLSGYIEMSEENRNDLTEILKKTTLSRVIETTKLIASRVHVVNQLKRLVFDFKKFTTERHDIQKIIESNYWLLGEEFNLVAADKTFNTALLNLLESSNIDTKDIVVDISNKRPDILLCSNYHVVDNNSAVIEENLIIELKRPSVKITKKEYQQIDGYKDTIVQDTRFDAVSKKWKFFLIGETIDQSVKDMYKEAKIQKRGLVSTDGVTFEIYVMSWEDLFTNFRIRYSHLLNKLGINEEDIEKDIFLDTAKTKKEHVAEITSNIINLKDIVK